MSINTGHLQMTDLLALLAQAWREGADTVIDNDTGTLITNPYDGTTTTT